MKTENQIKAEVQELLASNSRHDVENLNFSEDLIQEIPMPRTPDVKATSNLLKLAEKAGGCLPNTSYAYLDANSEPSIAKVFDLYEIPEQLVHPFIVCYSGFMTAHLYAFEAMRWHFKQTSEILPLFCIGKDSHHGLAKKVFQKNFGLMMKDEAESYMKSLSWIAPEIWVRQYQTKATATDTPSLAAKIYRFAKQQQLSEITLLFCTGNPFSDKRLLSEMMLELGKRHYDDVTINLAIIHCPLKLKFAVPEGHISELLLDYAAAELAPLTINTTELSTDFAPDFSKERYLLPEVDDIDWNDFRELICKYSALGRPSYQEKLFGIDHDEALLNVILANLRARKFFDDSYDDALYEDMKKYQYFIGKRYVYGKDFEEYLCGTTGHRFFSNGKRDHYEIRLPQRGSGNFRGCVFNLPIEEYNRNPQKWDQLRTRADREIDLDIDN